MDTTQDPMPDSDDAAEVALDALEKADPAEAPEVAERLAGSLTAALEEREPQSGDTEGTR